MKSKNDIQTPVMEKYSLDTILDETFGKKGTEKRDKYDADLRAELDLCCIGGAIRDARKAQKMTQAELGEKIGVKKAQISRIESGKNLTFLTVAKIFKAMNISANLDLGVYGRLSLW